MEIKKYIEARINFDTKRSEDSIWEQIYEVHGFPDYDDNDPKTALFLDEKDFNKIARKPFIESYFELWGVWSEDLDNTLRDELQDAADRVFRSDNHTFYLFNSKEEIEELLNRYTKQHN